VPNTYTPNYHLAKPSQGDVNWDDEINGNFDIIDQVLTQVTTSLESHAINTDNPHNTTYAQVGAAPTSHTHQGSDILGQVSYAANADRTDNIHLKTENNLLYFSTDNINWTVTGEMTKAVYDTNNDGIVDNADRIDGYDASDFFLLGNTNQSINLFRALNQQIDTRNLELVYDTNGNLTMVYEKDGGTTVKTTTLGYDSNGNLSTVTEQAGGRTITTSLSYDTNGNLTVITRQVS
jgi:YD repeat-containing protein